MHLDEGTIHAWLDGALDADEAARVEQHAAECGQCAAAVAEARGLVAGASRILTALDGVPGGVVPKTATSLGAARAKRTSSLWSTLHLTPARAAAAAVVVMAVGTALVLRNAPNAARSAVKLADYPRDSAVTFQPAAPMVLPHAAPDTGAAGSLSAPPREARLTTKKTAAPQPVPAPSRRAVMQAVEATAVAQSDSTRREKSEDSLATKESAVARSAVADNVARGAVGGVARAAAAPPSAVAQRYGAPKAAAEVGSAAGCYVVTTDSGVSLPPRLRLDSALSVDRNGVSEIVNDAWHSIAGAYWTPLRDGSIRLSLPALAQNVHLLPTSSSTLVGPVAIGGRTATVALRRAECGKP